MNQSAALQRGFFSRAVLFILASLIAITFSSSAFAAGRIVWKSTTIEERVDKEYWMLSMEIHLPSAPSVAYLPVKFEFQPTALYERSLVDGKDEPVERTIPLQNQQSLIESVDVGFLDAGTGVIQSRTRFKFKVTRAHDFQAGEYKVTVKNSQTGQKIGVPTTLRFKGENKPIDRRSIVFTGKKKKAKEEPAAEEPAEEEEAAAEEPAEEAAPSEPVAEDEAGASPPPVKERPGGGCHHGPSHAPNLGFLLFIVAFGLFAYHLRSNRREREEE